MTCVVGNPWYNEPMREKKVAIIMRGIPGSGKSYTARQKCLHYGGNPHVNIFSTDNFWIEDVLKERLEAESKPDYDKALWDELELETYRSRWGFSRLSQAHGWNLTNFTNAVTSGMTPVIVDNVNTTAKDMYPYVKLAEESGYQVIIQEPESQWWLDHKHMLGEDKRSYGTELEDFARFLGGVHEGYASKYGARGNQHGVPLDTLRAMIRKWQGDLSVDDIMGRTSRFPR
jgi:hypothetical protein